MHRHLFPFEFGRQPYECQDHICLLRCGYGGLALRVDGRLPVKRDPCAEKSSLVSVLNANRVRLGVCKVEREGLQTARPILAFSHWLIREWFVIEEKPDSFCVAAGITVCQREAELIVSRNGHFDRAGPAHAKV